MASFLYFGNVGVAPLVIELDGIASAEAFDSPSLHFTIYVDGIASAEAFDSPSLHFTIYVDGIATVEAFGVPHFLAQGEPIVGTIVLGGDISDDASLTGNFEFETSLSSPISTEVSLTGNIGVPIQ